MALVVKTTASPQGFAEALRQQVRQLDRNLPLAEIRAMSDVTADALARPRFAASLLGLFALVALVLAGIGTYATIALLVSERAHEIGIRMALGAERGQIVGAVLLEGVSLAGAGAAAGVAGALLLTRLVATLLYGVSPLDPLTFATVPIMLLAIAVVAAVMPARRAASINPVATLRQG
jgi:ABC-type antimicrobial peptide transport system permease subunit